MLLHIMGLVVTDAVVVAPVATEEQVAPAAHQAAMAQQELTAAVAVDTVTQHST